VGSGVVIPVIGLAVMPNSDVNGGHRPIYESRRYPRDAAWAKLEPLGPEASPGGRPRKTDMRAAMGSILYLLRTAYRWRRLPRDSFPPRSTVYNIFRKVQGAQGSARWRPKAI
jgi:hypothetical protein